jgi:hypothetical protein
MRVNCNFLPLEHRAFILDKKVMAIAVLVWIASVGMWVSVFANQSKEAGTLASKIKDQERERNAVIADRSATQYPQDQIQRLIDKFSFIRDAMGVTDFPYLRFYQSLEDAVAGGVNGRKVNIVSLKRCGDKCWTLEGDAEHWSDATAFEEAMIASQYGTKKNFSDVRLLNYRNIDKDKGYRFVLQFNFNETL